MSQSGVAAWISATVEGGDPANLSDRYDVYEHDDPDDLRLMAASPYLLAALRRLEWVAQGHNEYLPPLLVCPACRRHKHEGHAETCSTAVAIAMATHKETDR